MSDFDSLWGDEYIVPNKKAEKAKVKEIKQKISKPKEPKVEVTKTIKSKKISLEEKLSLITQEVLRVLSKQKDNIVCIKTLEDFHNYISSAISVGRIAIDTETNNSLDPITCKLMGLCLYYPTGKQAYIPINHRDPNTKERLSWQLTETDVYNELKRVIDAKTYSVLHNGKFDYEVLKCTCNGIMINIDWDTMIGAKLLDENERSAGLKQQYIDKIDPEQEKYDIEHLFEGVEYADVDPEIFAYYAATDSRMTDKLFEWQMNKFKDPDLFRVLKLAEEVEMPLVHVIAEMEMAGMDIDQDYAKILAASFHKKLEKVDKLIDQELQILKPQIDAWRLTPDANFKATAGRTKTIDGVTYKYSSASGGPGDTPYWYEAKTLRQLSLSESNNLGLVATEQKSKAEQLTDPINLGSPTQLAILFYDILKSSVVDRKQPRATGEDALKAIEDRLHLNICHLLLERRELTKLITTYIDPIPELAKQWPDGRVRTHFQQYGADTGRLSSGGKISFGPGREFGGLNFQNIPSHNKSIRMLFCAQTKYHNVTRENDSYFIVPETDEVMVNFNNDASSWKYIGNISIGDEIISGDDSIVSIKNIIKKDKNYFVYINE